MTKKVLSFVAAFVLVFSMSSCNQDLMEAKYSPVNNDVTFEMSSTTFSLEGQALVVKINRGVAKEAISIPLSLTDANGVYTLSKNSADFAAGEYTTEVSLTYNIEDLKPIVNYAFTLSFNEQDMALAGTNKITANCQMPLVYRDWGVLSSSTLYIGSLLSAEQRSYKVQLADYTNNYFKIIGFYGGETDLEFNIQDGCGVITVPGVSYYSALGSAPLAKIVTGAVHPTYGVMTAWLDMNPAYFVCSNLDENGTLQLDSTIDCDAFYTVSAGYFGWKTDSFVVSAVN